MKSQVRAELGTCAIDGCRNDARNRTGLCHGHYQRKMRGQVVDVPLKDAKGAAAASNGFLAARRLLRKAAINFSECDGDESVFERYDWNLGYAARQYVANLPARSLEPLGLMRVPGIRLPRG